MKLFPEDIIYGNIEPAKVQTESPRGVYEMARQIVEKGKKAPAGIRFFDRLRAAQSRAAGQRFCHHQGRP